MMGILRFSDLLISFLINLSKKFQVCVRHQLHGINDSVMLPQNCTNFVDETTPKQLEMNQEVCKIRNAKRVDKFLRLFADFHHKACLDGVNGEKNMSKV